MKRKITRHGPSSLTVSLPAKWVKKNNLKAGEEIEVEESEDSLTIYVMDKQIPVKKANLDFSDLDEETILYILPTAHKKGYDELEISHKNSEVAKIVQRRISNMLLGYEIIESSPNRCIVKNVALDAKYEFKNLVRRLFQVTISLCTEIQNSFSSHDRKYLNEAIILEKTNNKLSNYCERLIIKGLVDNENKVFHYLIVWQLEKIADHLKEICSCMANKKRMKITQETENLFERMRQLLEDYTTLYFNFNLNHLNTLKQETLTLRNDLKVEMAKKIEINVLSEMFSIVNVIQNLFSSALAINYKWEQA